MSIVVALFILVSSIRVVVVLLYSLHSPADYRRNPNQCLLLQPATESRIDDDDTRRSSTDIDVHGMFYVIIVLR